MKTTDKDSVTFVEALIVKYGFYEGAEVKLGFLNKNNVEIIEYRVVGISKNKIDLVRFEGGLDIKSLSHVDYINACTLAETNNTIGNFKRDHLMIMIFCAINIAAVIIMGYGWNKYFLAVTTVLYFCFILYKQGTNLVSGILLPFRDSVLYWVVGICASLLFVIASCGAILLADYLLN